MPSYLHTILRSPADWERARSGDPAIWSYDQDGKLAVAPDAFAAHRAARQTGHKCGPIVRIVLPLPTDYPEPSR